MEVSSVKKYDNLIKIGLGIKYIIVQFNGCMI